MNNICSYVGAQVRYFRKLRGITLKELSKTIDKSISTISKYESGSIPIDIHTLQQVADALKVTLEQLIPSIHETRQTTSTRTTRPLDEKHFFNQSDVFYVYYNLNSNQKADSKGISVNVIEITRKPDGQDEVVFYNECTTPNTNYRNCIYVYKGNVRYHDFVVYFILENVFHKGSFDYICAKVPFNNINTTTGLYTGLSESIRNPSATKVIISTTPLELTDELASRLLISDKETIYDIKHKNSLVIK